MENNTKPNDSVTPIEIEVDIEGGYGATTMTSGLTKREYFAAMALQGIIAAHDIYTTGIDHEVNAKTAVTAADALINALNQTNDTQTN